MAKKPLFPREKPREPSLTCQFSVPVPATALANYKEKRENVIIINEILEEKNWFTLYVTSNKVTLLVILLCYLLDNAHNY